MNTSICEKLTRSLQKIGATKELRVGKNKADTSQFLILDKKVVGLRVLSDYRLAA
jgi:hypothetical protein